MEDGILKCSVWLNVVTHCVHDFHVTYLSWFLLFFRKKSYYTDGRNKSMGRLVDDAWFVYDSFVIWGKKQEDIRLSLWAVVNFRKKHFIDLFKRFQNWLVANLTVFSNQRISFFYGPLIFLQSSLGIMLWKEGFNCRLAF